MTKAFGLGGGSTSDVAEMKWGGNQASNPNYSTFQFPAGTPLQVTPGSTLYITRLYIEGDLANKSITILYGDDAVDDAVGAPTNPVLVTELLYIEPANKVVTLDVLIPIPSAKYPAFQAVSTGNRVHFAGIEIVNP